MSATEAEALTADVLSAAVARDHETFQQACRLTAVQESLALTRRSGIPDVDVTNLLRIASFIYDGVITDPLPLAEPVEEFVGASEPRQAYTAPGAEPDGAYL